MRSFVFVSALTLLLGVSGWAQEEQPPLANPTGYLTIQGKRLAVEILGGNQKGLRFQLFESLNDNGPRNAAFTTIEEAEFYLPPEFRRAEVLWHRKQFKRSASLFRKVSEEHKVIKSLPGNYASLAEIYVLDYLLAQALENDQRFRVFVQAGKNLDEKGLTGSLKAFPAICSLWAKIEDSRINQEGWPEIFDGAVALEKSASLTAPLLAQLGLIKGEAKEGMMNVVENLLAEPGTSAEDEGRAALVRKRERLRSEALTGYHQAFTFAGNRIPWLSKSGMEASMELYIKDPLILSALETLQAGEDLEAGSVVARRLKEARAVGELYQVTGLEQGEFPAGFEAVMQASL
ncbi:MAG: hypothetical protein AAF555_10875 [Verrucomicrobiota bacterium]